MLNYVWTSVEDNFWQISFSYICHLCHLLKYKYHLITRAITIRCKGKELNQMCPSGRAISRYIVDIWRKKPMLADHMPLFILWRNIWVVYMCNFFTACSAKWLYLDDVMHAVYRKVMFTSLLIRFHLRKIQISVLSSLIFRP